MDLQEIDVFIEPDGSVRIEVRGVKGTACLDLTRELEAALGDHVESRDMTPEAYEQSTPDQVAERLRRQQPE